MVKHVAAVAGRMGASAEEMRQITFRANLLGDPTAMQRGLDAGITEDWPMWRRLGQD